MTTTQWATQMAKAATATPETATYGRFAGLRGRAAPGLAGRLIDALGKYWKRGRRPAIVASVTLDDGRWACIGRLGAGELAEDLLPTLADAGCRVLGLELRDMSTSYYALIEQPEIQQLIWASLIAGDAGPELVAEVLAVGV